MSSFFGSVKDKLSLSKKPTWRSSHSSHTSSSIMKNPFLSPAEAKQAEADAAAAANSGGYPTDAPPAYSYDAAASSASLAPSTASKAPSMISVTNDNDKYAFLSTFDTVFLIDDSGSMAGSNWDEVQQVLRQIAPVCTARDKDGIDLYFLNHKSKKECGGKAKGGYYNITSSRTIDDIFSAVRPSFQTPTGHRLNNILKPYVEDLQKARDMEDVKPINVIVITDGCPSDDPEGIIVQHAKKLDKLDAPLYQVGIQFFQVGNNYEAREALQELDDGLAKYGIRDMVDTATWNASGGRLSADGILKVVLGAVVRKIDRKDVSNNRLRP
jgi:hypothetical protein